MHEIYYIEDAHNYIGSIAWSGVSVHHQYKYISTSIHQYISTPVHLPPRVMSQSGLSCRIPLNDLFLVVAVLVLFLVAFSMYCMYFFCCLAQKSLGSKLQQERGIQRETTLSASIYLSAHVLSNSTKVKNHGIVQQLN